MGSRHSVRNFFRVEDVRIVVGVDDGDGLAGAGLEGARAVHDLVEAVNMPQLGRSQGARRRAAGSPAPTPAPSVVTERSGARPRTVEKVADQKRMREAANGRILM